MFAPEKERKKERKKKGDRRNAKIIEKHFKDDDGDKECERERQR